MQKIKYGVCLAIAMLAGLSSVPAKAQCALSVGWFNFPPYSTAEAGADPTGLDIELARAVADAAGCQLRFQERSWTAILRGVEDGSIDMATSASRTPEREAFAYYASSYRQEQMRLVVRTGDAAKHPLADLGDIVKDSLRIGASKSFYYGERFAELEKDAAFSALVDVANEDAQHLGKLLAGRLFGFLTDPLILPPLLKAKGAEGQVELHPIKVLDHPVHMIFSRKSVKPEILERIETATRELKASGKLDAIVARYGQVN
ncbi:MAG TPA: transporter substrate-binding domain-containing protein [Azospirillaceae bacterium]|nr:transporter substrate-binding domain-containing protein [Azospirillaceae bacterium]